MIELEKNPNVLRMTEQAISYHSDFKMKKQDQLNSIQEELVKVNHQPEMAKAHKSSRGFSNKWRYFKG